LQAQHGENPQRTDPHHHPCTEARTLTTAGASLPPNSPPASMLMLPAAK